MRLPLVICLAALALAGCDTTLSDNSREGVMRVADTPLPPEVTATLPAGVTPDAVFVRDGCYFFVQQGRLIRFASPDNPETQYCVG